MYISAIKIKNIRSSKKLIMDFKPDDCAGWHVLIGDNGSGKSSVAKAIALGLIGIDEAHALREDWKTWLRQKTKRGHVELTLLHDNIINTCAYGIALERTKAGVKIIAGKGQTGREEISDLAESLPDISQTFSASYGPFRRFKGGSKESDKLKDSYSRLLPHLSLFGEDFALSDSLEWIENLRFKQLEKRRKEKFLLFLRN